MQQYQFKTMMLKYTQFMTKPGIKLMEHLFIILYRNYKNKAKYGGILKL